MTIRRKLADVLVRAAYRLDPHRPKVTTAPDGGHTITFRGVPLARVHVTDGKVRAPNIEDTRPQFTPGTAPSPGRGPYRSTDPDFPRGELPRPQGFVRDPRNFAEDLDDPEFDGPTP